MNITMRIPNGNGQYAVFEGSDGRGKLCCADILPLSIAWNLSGTRLGDVVAFDDLAGKWLEPAIIVSADASPAGTCFELTY